MKVTFSTDVGTEPLLSSGSVLTSATFSSIGDKAGGVTRCRFLGATPANPWRKAKTKCKPKREGSPLRKPVTYSKETSVENSCLIMRGDLELAIRDLSRCRAFSWISDELRRQLGACLYELTLARRMCP